MFQDEMLKLANRSEFLEISINMKGNPKEELEKLVWDQMNMSSKNSGIGSRIRKLMGSLLVFICIAYIVCSLHLLMNTQSCWQSISCTMDCGKPKELTLAALNVSVKDSGSDTKKMAVTNIAVASEKISSIATDLKHIVFGIAASASLWETRKEYIKLWWRPDEMRGFVWLDKEVKPQRNKKEVLALPPLKISTDTSHFKYTNKQGHHSAIRISRIVSETFRLGLPDVHWFVMGDDDTVFVTENLVRVLSQYDHRQMYYIGSLSESHLQNIFFSYGMAYGGGGFAISFPLAKALESMQDDCIQRYPGLYGSDDRMQACMAELGVPLTKEPGFHQYDVYGNLFGLLAAHPVRPLVSLHHLDVVEPIFPNLTRVNALQHLFKPIKLDPAAILQQSICYDDDRKWSISVSWGYSVQIFRGIFSPRDLEMPSRTFLNWYRRADFTAYSFNTRPVTRHPCQKPFVFYLKNVKYDSPKRSDIISNYTKLEVAPPECRWRMASPETIDWIKVVKKPNTFVANKSPRRNCCRLLQNFHQTLSLLAELSEISMS
ncbi:hypothetical protein SUGI_0003200 [Cryptomeria japonica]|nr:hypothetical protein SUGI_0003200 [Cryptomeria japonica]